MDRRDEISRLILLAAFEERALMAPKGTGRKRENRVLNKAAHHVPGRSAPEDWEIRVLLRAKEHQEGQE